jgi:hypothetical protein
MKWMITYALRPEGTWRSYDENIEGLANTFANWKPPEGVQLLSLLHRADGKGGWMLVESDDATGPSKICLQFIAFHDADLHPVLETTDVAQGFVEAMAWRRSVAG